MLQVKKFTRSFIFQVWYAASYAEFVNQKVHDVTEEERKGKLSLSLLK